jgi:hypothetical protein
MTRETQINELIGSTILSTSARIREDTDHLRHAVSDALSFRTSFNINKPALGTLSRELEAEYRKRKSAPSSDRRHEVELGVLRGSWFVNLSLERMMLDNDDTTGTSGPSGIPIVMCFSPSVVTKSALLGTPLVLRSVHLPPASVLERLNSLLEDPRSLVLGEDTQRVFSNPDVIRTVTGSSSRSIPICAGFVISGTTTEAGFIGLSGPLQSRFTYIAAVPYSMEIPRGPSSTSEMSDLRKIALTIVEGNRELMDAIEEIYRGLKEKGRVKVTITEYVRWCMTASNLLGGGTLSAEWAAGIAALRTIVDALPNADRRRVTKDVLQSHLPVELTYLIVTDGQESPVFPCPVELVNKSISDGQMMKCKASTVTLPGFATASLEVLNSVLWTQSAVDMAEAVLTAVAAGAITIFEGSPDRGKTAVASAILRALGMQCTRINLSPTTSADDLFGREIPQSAPEGGFSTRFVAGPLTLAMQRSCSDENNQILPSQAILLDEINLASPQLLERLEGFMLRMVRRRESSENRYLLPNGKDVFHGSIVIVATMNSAALSNARSALSRKLQGASHFLRLVPFSPLELKVLAGAILADPGQSQADPTTLAKILKAHSVAAKLLERESGSASERDAVTLREFLRVRQFRQECKGFGIGSLIELAYGT